MLCRDRNKKKGHWLQVPLKTRQEKQVISITNASHQPKADHRCANPTMPLPQLGCWDWEREHALTGTRMWLCKPVPHCTAYYGLSGTVRMGTGLEAMAEQHKQKGSRATKWQIKSCWAMQESLKAWFPWTNWAGKKLNSSQARKPKLSGIESTVCPAAIKQNQASI